MTRTVSDAIAAVRAGSVSARDAELLVEEIDALRACVADAVTYWDGGGNRQALLTKHHAVIGAIEAAVAGVLAANPDKVEEYRGGKEKMFGFFVGQAMKAMASRGNPALVNAALKRALR